MKRKLLALLAALPLFCLCSGGLAAEPGAASSDLKDLVGKINTKLQADKKTEADLKDELKEFDTLLAKYKDEKTDDVAQILYMKAMLFERVLKQEAKSAELMAQLKRDFPNSKQVKMVARQEEANKLQGNLVEGKKFPEFTEKDLAGKPLSVANYKGKVLLLDFWATWCGPCVGELPNVLKTYQKHHAEGFEIIGISLDDDEKKLLAFIKSKNIPWPQYFDGKGWENKLAQKYGIQSIPATFLLDGEGKIIAKDARGESLEEAVAKAVAKK
jgi:thiol-disulfide isomerase/thioredoxin